MLKQWQVNKEDQLKSSTASAQNSVYACMVVFVTCSIAIYVGSISGHSCVTHSYSMAENNTRVSSLCKHNTDWVSEPMSEHTLHKFLLKRHSDNI